MRTMAEAREVRRHLKNLTLTVSHFIAALDGEMKRPSCEERGRRIAKLIGHLELQNDLARRYGLGLDQKGRKIKWAE